MISQPLTLIRINKLGKPYVQDTDPSLKNTMAVNDIWLNTSAGTMKTWDGSEWTEMQFGGSAIMDDCITNRMLANDISASKITAGILRSQNGDFYLDLESGEAKLLNLMLGGQVEGNIIATSSNGLTRVRLRGREGERDITAGIVFEQREGTGPNDEWENAGQLYFSYASRRSYAAFENFQVGKYNSGRPTQAYNAGSADGLMWRSVSTDWLRASYATYHGFRLAKRADTTENFTDVPAVMTAIGNCMDGASVECDGVVTCTYQFNDIVRIDFNLKVTAAGSGADPYGISVNALRQINADIPNITPMTGGTVQIYGTTGSLSASLVGATLLANDDTWQPAYVSSGSLVGVTEQNMTLNTTFVGTCYGKYSFGDEI